MNKISDVLAILGCNLLFILSLFRVIKLSCSCFYLSQSLQTNERGHLGGFHAASMSLIPC